MLHGVISVQPYWLDGFLCIDIAYITAYLQIFMPFWLG